MKGVVAAVVCALGAGTVVGQTSIRYDFAISVASNTFDPAGGSSVVGALSLGETGSFSLTASTTSFADLSFEGGEFYSVEAIQLDIGGVSAGGDPAVYPISGLVGSLGIENDAVSGAIDGDFFGAVLSFDDPEFGFGTVLLTEDAPGPATAGMLNSAELPRSIDLTNTAFRQIVIEGSDLPSGERERARFTIDAVAITLIPSPGSGLVLAALGLGVARRRR